ncbi:MAG: UDP-N-acetylmuramoyl-L-alanyl-D-glutamate--2,6-diaminopimelate ligase [Microbacterium sp.]|uniref:Mur ligase family protein n=1 Tax=Microbacterium sp. TaxID=51671 RepID=UPI001ACC9D6A|nr:UDP-N-acetylmuramoyl-L-alanyl-D-glutamate--2,6-diaminopimelate ligase [Microbacterium sp.]MBN9178371.1 UDP-N-acetylmuramoyl-L-alanyl-D-glutamate--2,6-diaminopimelate ligase [Microbacterium sp.]
MTPYPPEHSPSFLHPRRPPRRRLDDLVRRLDARLVGAPAEDVVIGGITHATNELRPGAAFVALPGERHHGAEFAAEAVERGAVAIITDAAGADIAAEITVPIVCVEGPRRRLPEIAAWIYGTDADLPILLGVTGTNGKTSVTHLLEGILTQIGVTAGSSSTVDRRIAGRSVIAGLTTPEASDLHALLAVMREHDVEAMAAEVSAQGLVRDRVGSIVFDVAGFTNLTHDHLDDFGDMETYLDAKALLFKKDRARRAVVSLDSAAGSTIVTRADVPVTTILTPSVAIDPALTAHWRVEIVAERHDGTSFLLTGPEGRWLRTTVPVIGRHMAANAGLAIVMLHEAGYAWDRLRDALHGARIAASIPGRTQRVSGESGPTVYVDFGHTPDAFAKTLAAVRRVTPGRVLMLCGADGDRDATKRAAMGRTAAEGSDILVITDHHPRFEDPDAIRAALVSGARSAGGSTEILDFSPPERAIVEAVDRVTEGDAILWAGPGHQNYRDIRGTRAPYSARELARRALRAAGWAAPEPTWEVPYPADSTPPSDELRPF